MRLVSLAALVWLDQADLPDLRVQAEKEASLEGQERGARQANRVTEEQMGHLALQEREEKQDLRAQLDLLASLGLPEKPAHQDLQERGESRVCPAHKDKVAPEDHLGLLVLMALLVLKVKRVSKDQLGLLVNREAEGNQA